MRKLFFQLLLIFLYIPIVGLQGQNVSFKHLTTDDGLSQFSVNSLYIDENGILWIGTREGLNRYNGEDIQTYKLEKNNPNSLFCNNISYIVGNQNGKIYLLCTEGVAEFNLITQNSRHCFKVESTVSIIMTDYSLPKRMKYIVSTKRPVTSTFIINWPAIQIYSACTKTNNRFGWEQSMPVSSD